ncbi:MAG TPA: DUF2239 family protein [Polyangia bacterium]|jgi:hypothetical protein
MAEAADHLDPEGVRQVAALLERSAPDLVREWVDTVPGAVRTGPGRPKLGVVCREVSLLPRHWEWLAQQPNGISAALRRLVDDARKREPDRERARRARDAASRFMTVMAGDRPGFEEASRALYAGERERFAALTSDWPEDIRRHLARLAAASFPAGDAAAQASASPAGSRSSTRRDQR